MKLLLNEAFAPITSRMGFIEAPCATVVDEYLAWQHDIFKPGGIREQHYDQLMQEVKQGKARFYGTPWERSVPEPKLDRRVITGPLAHALAVLPPLSTNFERKLWIPTKSAWTAYFDNGKLGTDPVSMLAVLAKRLGCRGLLIDATPDTMGTKSEHDQVKRARYGACAFELFVDKGEVVGKTLRAIYALNDGGRWVFETSGEPLPFEEPEHYAAKRIPDRFPFELLDRYCCALGIRPFEEDFYLPPDQPTATLVEWAVAAEQSAATDGLSLAEVQADLGELGLTALKSPRRRKS